MENVKQEKYKVIFKYFIFLLLFLILGVCSIIRPLKFKKETIFFENPFDI